MTDSCGGHAVRDLPNQAVAPIEPHDGSDAAGCADPDDHDRVERHKAQENGNGRDELAWRTHVNRHAPRLREPHWRHHTGDRDVGTSAIFAFWARRTPRLEAMHLNTPQRVGEAVEAALDGLSRSVESAVGSRLDLFDPLELLASRGKRMRSTLLMMSHSAAGGAMPDVAIRVAAALELFQVAALIHDDVLDDSDTRRGLPSTHRALEGLHAASHWRGDGARFGTGGAILAGDLALMACMGEVIAALAGVDEPIAAAVGSRFTDMATICTAGQYLDLRLAALPLEGLADERQAIETVMRCKTASYTTVGPLALGAALAGCTRAEVDAWAAVGLPLGVAFQLRDDVLGAVGSESETGKPAGDDVREGKRTLLLAHALEASGAADRDLIASAVGGNATAVAAAVDVLVRSGAIDAAEKEISRLLDVAKGGLEAIAMHPDDRSRLAEIFEAMAARRS